MRMFWVWAAGGFGTFTFWADNKFMRLLYFLADVFIDGFGITRPTAKTRTRAALFILALLVVTLAGVMAAAWVIRAAVR